MVNFFKFMLFIGVVFYCFTGFASSKDTLIVALDGSGDYNSIQLAINQTSAYPNKRKTIFIKNGIYHEKVKLHSWNTNLQIIGESTEHTIITYNDHFNQINLGPNSTFHTYTVLVDANDIVLKYLTIQNTAGKVGQAIALAITATRVAIFNCNIIGNQDTLFADGEGVQYYQNCNIQGTTDFIFGNATAWFQNCTIHSKSNSFITAASTTKNQPFGFVFFECFLTADASVQNVYLGRPWREHAKTVFIYCYLGSHIAPKGWHHWDKPEILSNVFYAEFQNTGLGNQPKSRENWSKQLTKKQVKRYVKSKVLNQTNSWYENL